METLDLYPVGSFVEFNMRGTDVFSNRTLTTCEGRREMIKVLKPEKLGVDVEQIIADVETRGERTEQMRR